MAEAWVATFKSELVDGRRFPGYEHAEHETLNWIGLYNTERLHEELNDLPPAEYEELNNRTVFVAARAPPPPRDENAGAASVDAGLSWSSEPVEQYGGGPAGPPTAASSAYLRF